MTGVGFLEAVHLTQPAGHFLQRTPRPFASKDESDWKISKAPTNDSGGGLSPPTAYTPGLCKAAWGC